MLPLNSIVEKADAYKSKQRITYKLIKVYENIEYKHFMQRGEIGMRECLDEIADIYAPVGFQDAVAGENLYAGIAMSRRFY